MTLKVQVESGRIPAAPSSGEFGVEKFDNLTRDCALARALLWALTRAGPVHVLRVLNVAVDLAESDGMSEEHSIRAELRMALDELADAGDAAELGDGWWLPAATRVVELGNTTGTRLLVGGLPTGMLPFDLQRSIAAHGPFRRVQDDRLRLALDLPAQALPNWASAPRVSLSEWATEILNKPLAKYTEPNDGARFRFYVPTPVAGRTRPGMPQALRWLDRPPETSGRFLVERTRIFGAREYRAADVRQGRVEACGAVMLTGEQRRLMYALDERANNPVEVKVTRSAGSITVLLWSELPRAEQRMFAALGDLSTPDGDRYYPRRWRFEAAHAEFVEERLSALGLSVVSGTRRGK